MTNPVVIEISPTDLPVITSRLPANPRNGCYYDAEAELLHITDPAQLAHLDLSPSGLAALIAAGPGEPPGARAARIAALVVSDRQFAQAAALSGIITQAEALAWVSAGTLPAILASAVTSLPEAQRFGVEMVLAGATTFRRSAPTTGLLITALGKTPEDADALFELAAGL